MDTALVESGSEWQFVCQFDCNPFRDQYLDLLNVEFSFQAKMFVEIKCRISSSSSSGLFFIALLLVVFNKSCVGHNVIQR
jgi:hypothetical protein